MKSILISHAKQYIEDRSKTAKWGAWFSDMWWVFALALIGL